MSLLVWLPLNGNLNNRGIYLTTAITSSGAAVNTTGKFNKCYYFDGTDDYISLTKLQNFFKGGTTPFSVCFWFYHSGNSRRGVFFGDYNLSGYDGGFNLEIRNNNNFRFYWKGNPDWEITTFTVTTQTWYHVAIVYDGAKVYIYVNGELNNSRTGALTAMTTQGTWYIGRDARTGATAFNGKINDFRIYDHILSIKEIKNISKALMLHYTFNDPYIENTVNLFTYPTPGSNAAPAWDATLHVGAKNVSGWSNGYNGGVTQPSIGYHACWKIIDDIPTMVMADINSQFSASLKHRWMGISGGGLAGKIGSNTTYTVSYEAMSDTPNKQISSGLYYKTSSSGSYNFLDGLVYLNLTTEWKRYSYTKTSKEVYLISSFYFYGHNGTPEGTSYIRNVQIEIKGHSTPYTKTTRTTTILADNSGLNNNGTINGTIAIGTDSSRSGNCILILTGSNIRTTDVLINATEYSFSFWIKPTVNLTGCLWNGRTTTGKAMAIFYLGGGIRFDDDSSLTQSSSITLNQWSHIVCTWKSGGVKRIYINGVKDKEVTAGTNVHTNTLASIGMSTTGDSTPSGNQYLGYISDYRIYATLLNATDIQNLYKDSLYIDDKLHMFTYQLNEENGNKNISKKGIYETKNLSEVILTDYDDPTTYTNDSAEIIRIGNTFTTTKELIEI